MQTDPTAEMRHAVADLTESSEKQCMKINSVAARKVCVTTYKASKVAKQVKGGPDRECRKVETEEAVAVAMKVKVNFEVGASTS